VCAAGLLLNPVAVSRKLWIERASDIAREYYLSITFDRGAKRPLLMLTTEGGVEIEQVAVDHPEAIIRRHADPLLGLLDYQAREFAFAMGLGGHLKAAVAIAKGLVRTMLADDADLVEINPLAIVRERDAAGATVERLVCLDAKVTLDDSALPRHPDLEPLRDPDDEDPADREARLAGLTFIKLDGTIGCMVNGAGLAMTTMDLVKRAGGEPANFLDIGGGARADKVAAAMRIILADPKVDAILVNIFGGITRGDEVARGLIEARAVQERDVPMVVRIVGTNAAEAAVLLEEAHFATAAVIATGTHHLHLISHLLCTAIYSSRFWPPHRPSMRSSNRGRLRDISFAKSNSPPTIRFALAKRFGQIRRRVNSVVMTGGCSQVLEGPTR
jgi:succinyl-CoA synthetase beta subunit